MSDSTSYVKEVVAAIRNKLKLNDAEAEQAERLSAYYLRFDNGDDHPWLNGNMTPRQAQIDQAVVAEIRAQFMEPMSPHLRLYRFDHGRVTAADLRHSRTKGPRAGKPRHAR